MAATPDGTFLRRVAPLHAAAYGWPRDCSTLFEYVNPFDAGWVVRDTRGRTRFVSFLTPDGDWRCTSGTGS